MLRWLYLDCSIMTARSKTRERCGVTVSLPEQCQRVQTVWRMPTGSSCVMQNPHNQITGNNFKQPVLSALLQLWHMDGVRTTDLSFLLPGTCPWKGPLLPASKKWCSMTAVPTEQTVLGRKGDGILCSLPVLQQQEPPAASLHSPALQALYLSCALRPGCAPRLWRSWQSKCNSFSAPLLWLLQLLESLSEFCLQNLL